MKKIGFLSFGHWTPSSQSQTRSAADTLLQSIDLAVAAEELGADGAYFRVHHFARQLASPFPLLAAVGVKTSRIEIGTAVIDTLISAVGPGSWTSCSTRLRRPDRSEKQGRLLDLMAGRRTFIAPLLQIGSHLCRPVRLAS